MIILLLYDKENDAIRFPTQLNLISILT